MTNTEYRMNRAIFLDRDGVINKLMPHYPAEGVGDRRNYVLKWEDFEFLPGVKEALTKIRFSEYIPIVVSNQACVGLFNDVSFGQIAVLFEMMEQEINQDLDMDIYWTFCPHVYADRCCCCKPKPGMIYQMAVEHDICLEESWMIGDRDSDIAAGWNAGIRNFVKIGEKLGDNKEMAMLSIYAENLKIKPSLLDAVNHILKQ